MPVRDKQLGLILRVNAGAGCCLDFGLEMPPALRKSLHAFQGDPEPP
jgi:hypothetical protein